MGPRDFRLGVYLVTDRACCGARGVDEPFVCDGNVATAAGCLAAQQLVGWAVERLSSQQERDRIFEAIQPRGSSSKREIHGLRRVEW